jgi:hypothetical protein
MWARRLAAHLDEGRHRLAGLGRIDRGAIAGDHAQGLEPPHALGDRWRRQAHPAAELVEADAPVALELLDDAPIGLVEASFGS